MLIGLLESNVGVEDEAFVNSRNKPGVTVWCCKELLRRKYADRGGSSEAPWIQGACLTTFRRRQLVARTHSLILGGGIEPESCTTTSFAVPLSRGTAVIAESQAGIEKCPGA